MKVDIPGLGVQIWGNPPRDLCSLGLDVLSPKTRPFLYTGIEHLNNIRTFKQHSEILESER